MNLKLLLYVALGIALIGLSVVLYQFNKKVPGLEDAKANYEMTANDLFNAFDSDEPTATAKYVGQVISVTGEVVRLKYNGAQSNVTLGAENSMTGGINCAFNEAVHGISEGQKITVKGRCQGMLLEVVLNNCTQE